MGLILDSTVLIAEERGRGDLPALLSAHAHEAIFLAAVTAAELLHGVLRADTASRRKSRSAFVEDVLGHIEIIDFDLACARRLAEVWSQLAKAGSLIGAYDMLIASTALAHGHSVATHNVAEFRRVRGLHVVDAGRHARQ